MNADQLDYYEEHEHLALQEKLIPKLVHVGEKPYKSWNLQKCKKIDDWEGEHAEDVIDAEGRTYIESGNGVYLERLELDDGKSVFIEWFDTPTALGTAQK